MDRSFERVNNVLNRMRDVLKCQKCFELKEEDSILFFGICDHFYCSDCLGTQKNCMICENSLDEPIKLVNDKSILSLYKSLCNFELPSRNDIKAIYEECKKSKEKIANNLIEKSSKNAVKRNLDTTEDDSNEKDSKKVKVTLENGGKSEEEESNIKEKPSQNGASPQDVNRHVSARRGRRPRGKSTSISCGRGRKTVLDQSMTPVGRERSNSLNTSVPDNSKISPATLKKNINKRNPKGETQLHLACKKSNFKVMKELVEAGADPNAKDNAGWTALHDSVFSGNIEVIKFLLDNGANVNIPGLENTTALHEAIAKGNVKVVKLLLDYGADINAMNIFRETPLDLVTKYNLTELQEILLTALNGPKTKVSATIEKDDTIETMLIYKHCLSVEEEKLVNKFAEKFKVKMVSSLTSKTSPTHIIVSGEKIEITWGLIQTILNGCWIVKIDWIQESIEEKSPKPASRYQVSNEKYSGFSKARINKRNQMPDLFCGCHFFFGGNFEYYSVKNLGDLGKEDVKSLVERNGGKILKRSPNPESLALEKTIPYHANISGSLRETAYYIIYQTEKWDPSPKYSMSHMKTLPVDWLISCICKFELIDPKEYTGNCLF